MARFDLPDGGWAEIADPKTVTIGRRKPVLAALGDAAAAGIGNEDHAMSRQDFVLSDELNAALIAAFVTSWSFEFPVTIDAVDGLPAAAGDALATECAKYLKALFPNFGVDPDPASPTGPLSA